MLKLLFSDLASLRICSNTLASILIDVDAFRSTLSTSIIFYLFVLTANIEKFPNTRLTTGENFSSQNGGDEGDKKLSNKIVIRNFEQTLAIH